MKISELPEEIKQKALKYQSEEKSYLYEKNFDELYEKNFDELQCAFCWDNTKEGRAYWLGINNGDFPQPDKLQQLIEWMEADRKINPSAIESHIYRKCIDKAKEIQKGN